MPVKNGIETVCVPLYWLNARGFERDGSALHLQRISPLQEKLTSGRTLCRIRAKDIRVQKLVPIWLWQFRHKRNHCTGPRRKVFPQHPGLYMASLVGRSLILCMNHLVAEADRAVPGRGLEPLRISPPDPKSGASANFATPASLIYKYLTISLSSRNTFVLEFVLELWYE